MEYIEKVVLVTGAESGIGYATALLLKEEGAIVIGTYLKGNIENDLGIEYVQLDITKKADCEDVVSQIVEKYGKIDVLINCAGIVNDAMSYKMTEQQFDQVIDVNLKGAWNITTEVGKYMLNKGKGSIVNISSIVGEYGNIGQVNYSATKAGIVGMTKSWAKEFTLKGAQIRVNVVAPGYTKTKMLQDVPEKLLDQFKAKTMLGRLAEPEEIAQAIAFIASDRASYITGTVLDVNGGMRL